MGDWFSGLSSVAAAPREIDISLTYRPGAAERIARDRWGRYTSAQAEISEAFETLAQRLQEMQVAALRRAMEAASGGLREQRGTHHLEDAILAPSNRQITIDGFKVGIDSAFDESPAGPYWRGLEEGTSVHIGQRMYGLWITPGGFARPAEGARDAVGFRGWRNVPSEVAEQYRDPENGRLPGFRIKRPIPAYGYLQQGIRDFLASGAIQEEIARAIERATGIQQVAIERGVSTAAVRAERRAAR
jgi:hypothetical protein